MLLWHNMKMGCLYICRTQRGPQLQQCQNHMKMSASEVLDTLCHTHILISDCAVTHLAFDRDGLRTLCSPRDTIEVHGEVSNFFATLVVDFSYADQSILVDPDSDEAGKSQLITASSDQLLEASTTDSGKILNALEFPMGTAPVSPTPKFSTDLVAWEITSRGTPPPIGDIRWGLAATPGARTWFHMDSNGFNTFIDIKCGFKAWMCINDQDGHFTSIDAFKDFELDDASDYQIEVILLTPGTRL